MRHLVKTSLVYLYASMFLFLPIAYALESGYTQARYLLALGLMPASLLWPWLTEWAAGLQGLDASQRLGLLYGASVCLNTSLISLALALLPQLTRRRPFMKSVS